LDGVVNELLALLGFAFVGTVSPGPNNAVLWAEGMRFGFRRTVPHVLGTAIGMATIVVGVAGGIGVLIEAVPAAELALKVVGSVYLLALAVLLIVGGEMGRRDVSHPFSLRHAVAFQWVNPKAWVFTIAAVGTFLSSSLPWVAGVALLTLTIAIVVVASSAIWAVGGAAIGRLVDDERSRRAVGVVLASLLVASVASIWI
jgi:threonine/homoserine/homoserine lactone efflux protein